MSEPERADRARRAPTPRRKRASADRRRGRCRRAGVAAGVAVERLVRAPPQARRPVRATSRSACSPTTRPSRSPPTTASSCTSRSWSRWRRTVKPTLVFVHGFCLDQGTFHFQRKALDERGKYRMVFYDQPGHGLSSSLTEGEYELPALGDALHDVIKATVPDGPIVLVGHSMGGMTIMAVRRTAPGAVLRTGRRRRAHRHLGRPDRRLPPVRPARPDHPRRPQRDGHRERGLPAHRRR